MEDKRTQEQPGRETNGFQETQARLGVKKVQPMSHARTRGPNPFSANSTHNPLGQLEALVCLQILHTVKWACSPGQRDLFLKSSAQ